MEKRTDKKIAFVGIILIAGVLLIPGYFVYTLSKSISILTEEMNPLEIELDANQQDFENVSRQAASLQNEIRQISENINNTTNELALRQSATRYAVHDPLYLEARNFLQNDSTDQKQYNETTFNCANYAQEVNNNAEKIGIRCAYVKINFTNSEHVHAIIAFEATDRGIIFFEPQTDERVILQIGKNYWDCVIPNTHYSYERSLELIIKSFSVYW